MIHPPLGVDRFGAGRWLPLFPQKILTVPSCWCHVHKDSEGCATQSVVIMEDVKRRCFSVFVSFRRPRYDSGVTPWDKKSCHRENGVDEGCCQHQDSILKSDGHRVDRGRDSACNEKHCNSCRQVAKPFYDRDGQVLCDYRC
jgi:hypothetical protein